MSKPKIKDIRRAYVLDILIRFAPLMEEAYPEGFPQKEIVIKIKEQLYNEPRFVHKDDKGEFITVRRESPEDLESKLITAVSKTVNSLEKDGIISISSLRTPGKRGGHQNLINLNKTPEALHNILKAYDETGVLGGSLKGVTLSLVGKQNLLKSEYYKSLANMDLVNDLTSRIKLPYTEEDKKLIHHLILTSPGALKNLFERVYEWGPRSHELDPSSKHTILLKDFTINSLQLAFIQEVSALQFMPNFNVEVNINVKFKDEDGKKVYEFSNMIKGVRDDSQANYEQITFI